jgi:hypothetical protein
VKVIMEFNLPEEKQEYDMHLRGPDYHSALWDLLQDLRTCGKHGRTFPLEAEPLKELFKEVLADRADVAEMADKVVEAIDKRTDLISAYDYRAYLYLSIIPDCVKEDL